jgi:hypothetical protein
MDEALASCPSPLRAPVILRQEVRWVELERGGSGFDLPMVLETLLDHEKHYWLRRADDEVGAFPGCPMTLAPRHHGAITRS